MKLEDIGFYTLSENRMENSSTKSPLWRCEVLLTDKCNFKCPYCRGMSPDQQGHISREQLNNVLDIWFANNLRNVRFSGGEPTMYPGLLDAVKRCKDNQVERIAISTNGSKHIKIYEELCANGVNDLSISLDACCAQVGDKMAGTPGSWQRVVENIQALSKITYVTVGMVFTQDNINQAVDSVLFADSLGVSDIRVIPSAQYNQALIKLSKSLPAEVLSKYKILQYRMNNVQNGRHVRGISDGDCHQCWLALDDMAVVKDKHYPCIIHLREHGAAIGTIGPNVRQERFDWLRAHKPWLDPICKEMCLDVCIDYNRKKHQLLHKNRK